MDIDAYAGCVAYAELLRLQGQEAMAVSTAPWNESISDSVRSWGGELETSYSPVADDEFIIIDLSNPEQFDTFVRLERVVEVIDHHPGNESYWPERIGDGARIEFIGAACTLVYERWQTAGLLDKMSQTSARLLLTGILDNTLNFGATVTKQRDMQAYAELSKLASLPADWSSQYFGECQRAILDDVVGALRNDTKELSFKMYPHKLTVGQLVVWDAKRVLDAHVETLSNTLSDMDPQWFLNLVGVGSGRSYFVCQDPAIRQWLGKLLQIEFIGSMAAAERLWLRKEILHRDLQAMQN